MPCKILHIEDELDNLQLVRDLLASTDYEVLQATTGRGGFAMALKALPDLILADINLPDISGIEVIAYFKQSPLLNHIPIVVITGNASDILHMSCLKAGAVDVILKPVGRARLIESIQHIRDASIKHISEEKRTLHARLKKVLVVDDNPDLRTIFARSFDRRQFAVTIAADGVEALQRLHEDKPDILILDINMPRLSGFDVLRHVRENRQQYPMKVVVVTGNTMAMTAPETEIADLLLVKPVSINDLITLAQRFTQAQT
jgi:CheY-like chemotaxis protein